MKLKNYIEHNLINGINHQLEICYKCVDNDLLVTGYKGGAFINENTDDIDLMFIAQNPGASNLVKMSQSGFTHVHDIVPFALDKENSYHIFFDLFFQEFYLHKKRHPVIYITNTIKCITQNNASPSDYSIKTCYSNILRQELLYFKKKKFFTVLLGKTAHSLSNKYIINSRPHVIMQHPGYMNKQGNVYVKKQANILMNRMLEAKDYK